jgi:phosphoglycolate phosphatase
VFDLDGVLIDSEPAIRASVDAALSGIDERPVTDVEVRSIIGPPLLQGLMSLMAGRGGSTDSAPGLLEAYRAHYAVHAVANTGLYPGIEQSLAALQEAGIRLAIATSKPIQFSLPILDGLGIDACFKVVEAPDAGSVEEGKSETLGRVVQRLQLESPGAVPMVGDRGPDMEAAVAHGLIPVGALWGYGSRAELVTAGAIRFLDEPANLADLIAG